MGKGSFIIYDSDLESLGILTRTQTGKLFKALAAYRLEGKTPDFGNDKAVSILFQQMLTHITINEEKYEAICQRNSESAKKRWQNKHNSMPAHAHAYERIQNDANACVNDNDNVNDNDYDNDYVNDNDTVPYGAKREKRKNYYGNKKNNVPALLRDEPSYDIEAFTRKAIGLKYEKKDNKNDG